jgi:plastocyanin
MHRFGIKGISRRRLAALGLGCSLLLAACSQPASAVAPSPTAATATIASAVSPTSFPTAVAASAVKIANFAFGPAAITVPAGTTVIWTNADIEQHTITARDRTFNSDALDGGKSFKFTFSKAGTYDYFCQIHPYMVGKVVVTPQSATTAESG